nr:hypothetical protein [Pseudonocardia sp.]
MTNDVRRLLHELLARVNALEAWRAHQSDLLDAVINNSSSPSAEKVSDDDPLDIVLDADQLVGWVHQHVAAVIARPLRGEYRWCPCPMIRAGILSGRVVAGMIETNPGWASGVVNSATEPGGPVRSTRCGSR